MLFKENVHLLRVPDCFKLTMLNVKNNGTLIILIILMMEIRLVGGWVTWVVGVDV